MSENLAIGTGIVYRPCYCLLSSKFCRLYDLILGEMAKNINICLSQDVLCVTDTLHSNPLWFL